MELIGPDLMQVTGPSFLQASDRHIYIISKKRLPDIQMGFRELSWALAWVFRAVSLLVQANGRVRFLCLILLVHTLYRTLKFSRHFPQASRSMAVGLSILEARNECTDRWMNALGRKQGGTMSEFAAVRSEFQPWTGSPESRRFEPFRFSRS
jgi:hypothetical protein